MQKITVIGGGAAGLAAGVLLARAGCAVTILERGDRLGRKLSASGNGQGNVTNLNLGTEHYFTDDPKKVGRILARHPSGETIDFLRSMGGIFLPDERGRVYPAGRMASAVTDLFRRELQRLGVTVVYGAQVATLEYHELFQMTWNGGTMSADKVLLCTGGKASAHFGTDGSAYALARSFGHTLTPLSPALVRIKTDPVRIKGLKGIRMDARLGVLREGKLLYETRGDVLFTDGGVSGDAVFRASSYAKRGDVLTVDFLPDVSPDSLSDALSHGDGEDKFLCVVPNGLGRFLYRQGGDPVAAVKSFRLPVTGDYGFSEAQVTKGGIPLSETDEHLQSNLRSGLYFAGEILNVDGECGGYNLQWAFASAAAAAEGMLC